MIPVLTPTDAAARLDELWSPRVLAAVDDTLVKVAKVRGSLTWHSHADEDELFYVLRGSLRIELEDGAVQLGAGQMCVVPKGVRHHPVADEECHLLLVERRSTRHTGDEVTAQTRSLDEQLRPL